MKKMTSIFRTLHKAYSVALLGALVFGLASCAESDDPNGMIKGSGKHYEIDYTNELPAVQANTSRGYKTTKLNHAGGLVKITFDNLSSVDGGVMGFIFDFKKKGDAREFFVIGLKNNKKYYVSKFTNVTDLQAENFGTKLADNPAHETTIVPDSESSEIFGTLSGDFPTDADGNKYAYVYAKCKVDGSYDWAILNDSATEKVSGLSDKEFTALEVTDDMYLAHGNISNTITEYTGETQNNLAVYANVYGQGTLTGSWDFVGTYKEVEIDE